MVVGVFTAIKILHVDPVTVWCMFVLFVLCMGATMFMRFRDDKWQKIPEVVH